jgi:hypothetical protein
MDSKILKKTNRIPGGGTPSLGRASMNIRSTRGCPHPRSLRLEGDLMLLVRYVLRPTTVYGRDVDVHLPAQR